MFACFILITGVTTHVRRLGKSWENNYKFNIQEC